MKKRNQILLCVILLLTAIFLTSCQNKDAEDSQTPAMGRYVEKELPFPEAMIQLYGLHMINTQEIEVLGTASDFKPIYFYSEDGGTTWEEKVPAYLDTIISADTNYYLYAAGWNKNDRLYLVMDVYDGTDESSDLRTVLACVEEDNTIKELFTLPTSSSGAGPRSILCADDGSFLINCFFSILHVDGTTGRHLNEYVPLAKDDSSEINGFDVYGNTLAVSMQSVIYLYDLKTKKQISTITPDTYTKKDTSSISYSDDYTNYMLVTYDKDGSLYFLNDNGLYHCINNNTMFEKIIDGSLTSLSIPAVSRTNFYMNENSFLLAAYSNNTFSLLNYTYDADMPTLPSEELTIYALEDNPTIRQTVGLFVRNNPQVHVIFEVGLATEDETREDVLKKLATNLLSGNGPDLLVLDELPVENYEKKSFLLDLSEFLTKKLKEDRLFSQIAESYKRTDGTVPAIPVRYSVPMMLLDQKDDAVINSLADLTAWAEKNEDTFDSALNTNNPEDLIDLLYPVCADSILTGDKRINEEELTQFLENINRLRRLNSENEVKNSEPSFDFGALPWMNNLYGINIANVNFIEQTYAPYTAILERKEGTLATLLHKNVYIPNTILAVNSQSKNTELALQFLDTALSDQALTFNFKTGLPISKNALDKNMEKAEGRDYYSYYDFDSIGLQIKYPDNDYKKIIYDIISSVDTKTSADPAILTILQEETKGYFNGTFSLEHTVSIIKDKTNTYLSEQN